MWNLKCRNGASKIYFKIDEDLLKKIKKSNGVSDGELQDLLGQLRCWAQNQTLPPESQDDEFLLMIIRRSKYNLETAKTKLVNYFITIKNFQSYWSDLGKLRSTDPKDFDTTLVLPKLTPENERIFLKKIKPGYARHFDLHRGLVLLFSVACVVLHRDSAPKYRFIIDLGEFSFFHFLKVTPLTPWRLLQLHEKIFSFRISGIDIVNAPWFVNKFLNLFRPFMKKKLYDRFCVHESYESLYQKIPVECLPEEYGGKLKCIDDFARQWDEIFDDEQELFQKFASFAEKIDN